MTYIYCYRIKELCIKLFIEIRLYSDTSDNEDNSLAEIFVSRNVISRRFL